ncbi:flagellar basal body P-ring formation chaperone FlgA [Undibacterium sp. Ji49W]|uniref:flagellar basal body P-ring formation chaperone FlgA n=1 Tax=Undibacterium sp. Ji49W TaxID=3413040 RepID=UPI003BF2EC1D
MSKKSIFNCIFLVKIFILFLGWGINSLGWARPLHMELRSSVLLKSRNISLADIVNVDATEQRDFAALSFLSVGSIPYSTMNMSLSRNVLERWVRTHAGDADRVIVWSGSQIVDISLEAQVVEGSDIVAFARTVLLNWMAIQNEHLEIAEVADVKAERLPAGTLRMKISRLSERLAVQKKLTVLLELWIADHFIKNVPVRFELNGTKKIWVSNRSIVKGEPIVEKDVDVKTVDLFSDSGLDIAQVKFASKPIRAKSKLTKGAALSSENIEAVPDAIRGDFGLLIAHEGLVSIESRVEIMEDGFMGQLIKVRPSGTENQIQVRIIGPGKVELR